VWRAWSLGFALLILSACHDTRPVRFVDYGCKDAGRCECAVNVDCDFGELCVDGACVPVTTPTDTVTPDADVEDTSVPPDGTGSDTSISAGELGWPCTANSDCNSNRCVTLQDGSRVCTKRCLEDCPVEWSCRGLDTAAGTIEFFCVPPRDRLCEACVNDSSCPGSHNLCVEVGGSLHCGQECGLVDCPDGYTCKDVTSVDGTEGPQCVPTSGVCSCTAETVGTQVPCLVENEAGICYGVQPCMDDGGVPALGECTARTPAPEVCDNLDNDCNGFPDDTVPVVACTRENDFGTCTGDELCIAGAGSVCTASIPAEEICDNLDNDCDGDTDEGFRDAAGHYVTVEHCGACNTSCVGRFANADEVTCDATGETPVCAIVSCVAGFVPSADGTCVRPSNHLCEPCTTHAACGGPKDRCLAIDPTDTRNFCARDCGPDNVYGTTDCPDGYTCETFDLAGTEVTQCVPVNDSCDCSDANAGQTRPCTIANAAGTCFGLATCDPATGWTGCTARTPSVEACNGLDDDCDGVTDDGLGGGACTIENTAGTCTGVERCDPEAETLTCAGPDPAVESCNQVDDDCDGETDEPFAVNVLDGQGQVVELVYSLDDANCGGCGLPCVAHAPATEVSCAAGEDGVFCRVDACEPGYYAFDGRACLPLPSANLCLPCAGDQDCQGPDDRCLDDYEDGAHCGRDCSIGSIYSVGDVGDDGYCTGVPGEQGCCPDEFVCGDDGQCRRESGACDCDVDGKLRTCASTNASGTCAGVSMCVTSGDDAGWSACSAPAPGPEVCDGVDNDCDGLVDQADDSLDVSALDGYPACVNVSDACPGAWTCARDGASFGWTCSARAPVDEVCNGLDDDCDGVVDNGFVDGDGRYLAVDRCGACGLDCRESVANLAMSGGQVAAGAVSCELVAGAPTCVPSSCAPGFVPFPTTGTASFCLPLAAKSCQPCSGDADCGFADDRCVSVGSDDGKYCAQRCDAAAPYPGCTGALGQVGCCPAGFTCQDVDGAALCQPDSGSCQCSAATAGLSRVCSATGNGGTTTCFGTETCAQSGGVYAWGSCTLDANVEVCDALDNDCDGVTDEGFLTGGVYATTENCGQCGKNCALAYSADDQHVFGVCDDGAAGGPACAIGGCLSDDFASGASCRVDGDCAGGVCDPVLLQCMRACSSPADCGGGQTCAGGLCATTCGGDGPCQAAFGETSRCLSGACTTTWDWVDLDTAPGNGCECPAADGLTLDTPDVLDGPPLPGAIYVDANCDGIDGDAATAIFVSSGSAGGDGTLAAPYATIGDAIAAFGPGDTHILVASGVYSERIALPDGVQLYGGYGADFTERDVVLFPTVIAGTDPGPGPVNPGTVYVESVQSNTVLAGFTILGYDVTSSNAASYGVYVTGSGGALHIVNNRIAGGRGGAGASGTNGATGQNGGPGANGLDTRECADAGCSSGSETQAGGVGGTNGACQVARGCDGMEADTNEDPQQADAPAEGCTYAAGGDKGTYQNGSAQYCKYDFTPGGNQTGPHGVAGPPGSDGGGGDGCDDVDGSVSGGLWVPASAASGSQGAPGDGGQGGSAGGWCSNNQGSDCTIPAPGANYGDIGGSGAGGGAGGCGGTGGAPGQSGGASIAIFVAGGGTPDITHNMIVRGRGGPGGDGGNGGTGGRGGAGGLGGKPGWPAWAAGVGGDGGRGGDGGDGGGGGGGCGGPAWGIAGLGVPTGTYGASNVFPVPDGQATGGAGGRGGLSPVDGREGTPGSGGASANLKSF